MPAWSAVSRQSPGDCSVTVLPDTEQMLDVVEPNTIGLPEPPPVADSVNVARATNVTLVGGAKPAIAWGATLPGVTVNDRVACAAFQLEPAGEVATTVQSPV